MNDQDKIRAAASALGKRAAGKPKRLTPEQREARRIWGASLTAKRLAKRAAAQEKGNGQ